MSRPYEIDVSIYEYNPSNVAAIKEAANNEWPFDDWYETEPPLDVYLSTCGRSNLCGGEGEDEFVQRLNHAIWKANGGYCRIVVHTEYLEPRPLETYESDEEEFEEWKKSSELPEKKG